MAHLTSELRKLAIWFQSGMDGRLSFLDVAISDLMEYLVVAPSSREVNEQRYSGTYFRKKATRGGVVDCVTSYISL